MYVPYNFTIPQNLSYPLRTIRFKLTGPSGSLCHVCICGDAITIVTSTERTLKFVPTEILAAIAPGASYHPNHRVANAYICWLMIETKNRKYTPPPWSQSNTVIKRSFIEALYMDSFICIRIPSTVSMKVANRITL